MSITDRFITGVLDMLPKDGLDKLNQLIDEDRVTKETIATLLQEYNVDPLEVLRLNNETEEVL